jgi:hypothetical protein
MFLINLIIIFLFHTLLRISFGKKREIDQIFVIFHTHTTYAETTLLSKACLFFPWLAGRFHNFELTQNREKTRNGLSSDNLHVDI